MKISNIIIPNGIALAPMAGVTDWRFRKLCASMGAEYAVTEMVSAKALCYEKLSGSRAPSPSAVLAATYEGIPTAIQIFGCEPEFMARAAAMLESGEYKGAELRTAPPAAIDINMGCPVRKVVSSHEGAAMMKNPENAAAVVSAIKKAVSIPVTVKIRSGWNKESKNAPEFAKMLEASGADAICIHGRTREQFYSPSSDNGIIAAVKSAVSIPVFGNGDIYSADDAVRMLEETGCDGIMVARGAMGNPWLFSEIKARLNGLHFEKPGIQERIETALSEAESYISERGKNGAIESRGRISWYLKGIPGSAAARGRINSASDIDEMREILHSLLKANQ